MDPRVHKVITLMKEEFRLETSLSEMAQSVNLSPSRLRYLFKTEVGVPPAQYLRSFRMQRAKELLETTFLSVKQIRSSIGINDHSHFIREFKKSYGVTPAQYRMRLANPETRTNLQGLLILVVDDDRDASERIGLMLEQAGACVTTMASAHKALEALQRMRPDVLIIDIGLPNADGEELIRKARALFEESGEQIPVVALAPHADPENAQATFSADLRISKLTGASQLADAVARLTGRIAVSSCVLESAAQ